MHTSLEAAVDLLIARTGGDIRLGLPLGLGKPNAFVNALYRRVAADASLRLAIYTALSLSRPSGSGALEQRFLQPFADRVYGDYEELHYLQDLKAGRLPTNITVSEFFFHPGSLLGNATAQQHYISSNYTHAVRDLNARGLNAVAQMLACRTGADGGPEYSLSCNPEMTLDLLPLLQQRREQGEAITLIGQVHPDLPFMGHDAQVDAGLFDAIIAEPACARTLFSVPNMPVSLQDHHIGLHASLLVRDGGTLQIGIGSLGDAVAHHLRQRHADNASYRALLQSLALDKDTVRLVQQEGGLAPFEQGLYACTEMVTESLLMLLEADIVRRSVTPGGLCMHGGFFLGSRDFYRRLRELPKAQRDRINMTRVSFVNQLYGDEALKREQRRDARFINTVFTATLLGAGVSDQLESGRVLSGVGGQYNFVCQAHELAGARSILMLRSWRERERRVTSNLVWQYGHATIPRHLRDIVVTEYGIADLRGRNDREVVEAMLAISDARFQDDLVKQAVAAGKLPADFRIPDHWRRNRPERLQALAAAHPAAFPDYPLSCDFDAVEQHVLRALNWLKEKAQPRYLLELGRRVLTDTDAAAYEKHLQRMALAQPADWHERLYRSLLLAALKATDRQQSA